MKNSFIWADLSTFDLAAAKQFYRRCFGWKFQDIGNQYLLCQAKREPVAGLYPMPKKFQRIKMPSFWMSYIQVQDIQAIAERAPKLGGKVEVKPEAAPGGGAITLIRDPLGAGFTCYEGEAFATQNTVQLQGQRAWHELHISDLESVKEFYTQLFNWEIRSTKEGDRHEIYSDGKLIAGIRVTSNEIKGDKEYWGVYFAVENLDAAYQSVEKAGGQVVAEDKVGDRPALLAYDSQGAAFYLIETKKESGATKHSEKSQFKWRASLGLFFVTLAIILNLNWVWGILFLLWVIPDIQSGSTYFFELVECRENPIIYWLIMVMWIALSIYFFFI
ncbi:Glyoxalase/bleomycin resistance protein/dioxygenase [[Leptolyngbya] sp. PCC 7376]|uniref:VOC family protein n=1 Tax=[Leptolyngbya] sp. PCC 7376 TaxID=111781 RepID=UPI00029F1504|nr:VOC family protein [[Leptolyngbya] sp. PCC 7376]AFY39598.1 Glyoxalase/bleomycin resistance protein/dioxygenase [[Leptolyngbya] sp. PCC 7376]